MKRNFLVFWVCILLSTISLQAEEVTIEYAQQIGLTFLSLSHLSSPNSPNVHTQSHQNVEIVSLSSYGFPNLYLLKSSDGWVVLSNDTRIQPILAYSTSNIELNINDIPDGLTDLLAEYNSSIQCVSESNVLDENPQWKQISTEQLVASNENTVMVPYRSKVLWNQAKNNDGGCVPSYNKLCPSFYHPTCGGRTYVGCTAVAMAQIMWYYKWPLYAFVPNTISPSGEPGKETHLQLYDWDLMPPTLHDTTPEREADMIATLLRDCGYAAGMKYGEYGSGASLQNAMDVFGSIFGYSKSSMSFHKRNLTTNWTRKLKSEIENGRPVLYAGWDSETSRGHTFVIDGYRGDYFHINWGWADRVANSAFYSLNSLVPKKDAAKDGDENYNATHQAVFGITPTMPSSIVVRGGEENIDKILVACNQISLEDYVFPVNLNGYFYSGTQVRLRPGCWLKKGSNVHIAIKDIPCNNRNRSVQAAPALRSSDNAGDITLVSLPNQQSKKVAIAETDQIIFSALYSVSGQLVQSVQGDGVNLQTLPQGFYILQRRTDRGNVLVEKVAVN